MEATNVKYRYKISEDQEVPILFRLYDSDLRFESLGFEEEILEHCMTLVGRQEIVYWLQNSPVEVNCAVKGIPFNPMAYKKVHIYSMDAKDFVDGFKYIYEKMSAGVKVQVAGIVLNLREWKDIGGGEIVDILGLLHRYLVLLHERFQEEEERYRVIVHLPATSIVLDMLARLLPTIVSL